MNKVINCFKKITIYHLLAFLIPFLVYFILYALVGVFKDSLFIHSDAGVQYYGTFKYFKDVINSSNTFPYTFSEGLGGTMYGTFFYILSSPLNILIFFIDDLDLAMFFITIIKIGLSGLNMFIYLNKKEENKKSLIFSLCYSLSSYIIYYHCNLMWLDAVLLAPLVIYGVEKIIDDDKDLMYIIFTFLTLLTNYYMGYMVCFFSFVYFFYYLYINNKKKNFINDNKKLIIKFILIDIFLALSISFILIPAYFESLNFLRASKKQIFNYIFIDLFADSYFGTGMLSSCLNPFMYLSYAGLLLYVLLFYYLFEDKENKKEKKVFILMLLLFLLPVLIIPLNKFWHLFSYPKGFNYRYSFLCLVFILPKLAKVFDKIKYSKKFFIGLVFYFVLTIYYFILTKINPFYYGVGNGIPQMIATFIIMGLIIYLLKKDKKKYLLYMLAFELIFNICIVFFQSDFGSKKILNDNYNNTNEVLKNVDKNYRLEMLNTISYNDSMIYRYHGISIFNSNANYRAVKIPTDLYRKEVDKDSTYNFYYYFGYNTIIDTILGIKYIGYDRLNSNYDIIIEYEAGGKRYLMENKYAFSLGFVADNIIKKYKITKDDYYINDLLNAISGSEDNYYIEIDIDKVDDNKYTIYNFDRYNEYVVYFDGTLSGDYNDNDNYRGDIISCDGLYVLYNDRKEETFTLEFDELNSDIRVYTYDIEKFKKFVNSVPQLNATLNNGNKIEGNIETNKSGVLVLTIPYEEGFTIYLDGKKVKYYEVMDGFIGIDIDEGIHDIKIEYHTPHLLLSIVISIMSILSIIGLEIIHINNSKKKKKKKNNKKKK